MNFDREAIDLLSELGVEDYTAEQVEIITKAFNRIWSKAWQEGSEDGGRWSRWA